MISYNESYFELENMLTVYRFMVTLLNSFVDIFFFVSVKHRFQISLNPPNCKGLQVEDLELLNNIW